LVTLRFAVLVGVCRYCGFWWLLWFAVFGGFRGFVVFGFGVCGDYWLLVVVYNRLAAYVCWFFVVAYVLGFRACGVSTLFCGNFW